MKIVNYFACKMIKGCFLLMISTTCFSQSALQKSTTKPTDSTTGWGIKFSGFVRNDVFFDSRQVISARPAAQGDLLLYPTFISKDINGKDINATQSFSITAITSRLSGSLSGPDAFGAKTTGVLEAEFFGNSNGNENVFRLRHAYVKLDWDKTQLLFGQYNLTFYLPECAPGVLSFNAGMPFQPFSRNPQIRVTQKLHKTFNIILATSSQIESFVSPGSSTGVALGSSTSGPNFINNAVIPNISAQIQYKKGILFAGATIDYKEIRPALSQPSDSGAATKVATSETVKGFSYNLFAKLTTKPLLIRADYVASQNLYDQLMIGGYLAYSSTTPYHISYKPLNVAAIWLDIAGTCKKVVPGIFFGYTKNNGANAGALTTVSYSRGITAGNLSIDKIIRVTPRVEIFSGKFKLGAEVEFTQATYGTAANDGKVISTTTYDVANYRVLFITAYYF